MKRNIIIASLMFMLTLFVASCVKEYEEPNGGTDVTWYVTGRDEDNNYDPIIIVQDDYLGFMDCSLGATSHVWQVSEDGTYMLSGTPKGSNIVFEDFIDETIGHTTTNESILVLFRNEGLHKIRLLNTFDDEVTYRYKTVQSQTFADEFTAKKVGDEYVIDTTLVVEVYGKTLIPGAKVYRDAKLLEEVQTGTYIDDDGKEQNYSVEINYGDKLYFVDNSTYKPNVFTWKCTAAGIGVDEEVSGEMVPLQFNKLTSGSTKYNVIHTVERSADLVEKSYITSASSKALTIPLDIYVNENIGKVIPKYELAKDITDASVETALYVSAINITLPNTSFSFSASQLDEDSDEYKALLSSITARGVGSSTNNSYACTGITFDENTPNLIRLEFGKQFYTSDEITLTLGQDFATELSDKYSTGLDGYTKADFMVLAGDYEVDTNLVNLLQDEVGDIDYLYKMLCEETGLTDKCYNGGNPTADQLATANSSLAFKKALRKVFFCDVDNDGNATAEVTIARIVDMPSYSSSSQSVFDSDDKLCLKLDVVRTSTKLRLGADYDFDVPAGTYTFSMNIAVDLNGNPLPTTGGIQAMICDPTPASYESTFFDGAALEYYALTNNVYKLMFGAGPNYSGAWLYASPDGATSSLVAGYDHSLSVTLSYFEPGTVVYIRDLEVTTATYSK